MTQKKTETKKETGPKLVKMEREDGKKVDVHPDMVSEYKKGGFHKA